MTGVQLDELIALSSKRRIDALMEPDRAFDAIAFIKNIEREFALEAEELLERMELSHLIVSPRNNEA
jgi:hypothetical protein